MGYWNQDAEGHSLIPEETGMIWGDEPADILGDAVDEIIKTFSRDVGRRPTKAEMFAGLKFVTGRYDDNMAEDDS